MSHVPHFLAQPYADPPGLARPDSVRRTSSVDMVPQADGDLVLLGLAEDPVHGKATCRALVAPDRTLRSIVVTPDDALDPAPLIGRLVGRGFRAAVDELGPPEGLLAVLLCELPVAVLLSGYGSLYTGAFPSPISDEFMAGLPVDVCAGWASSADMVQRIERSRAIPTPDGPPVPPEPNENVWHDMAPLAPGSMRRQRLIERTGPLVWAMFRDTYARLDGVVIVLHEYTLTAELALDDVAPADPRAPGRSRVLACSATPRVLPWAECPSAAASAARVEGQLSDTLRSLVRDDLVGTSTCTHLNDLLASLSQVDALMTLR